MQQIISEMTSLLSDESVGAASDRALLLDCRSTLEKDTKKAINLLIEALELVSDCSAENPLLCSNLHSNLGALYRLSGDTSLARQHMEEAISILNENDLIGYHDTTTQIVNYAVLLHDIGEPECGLMGLRKIARTIKEAHTENCSDYAIIQETMGTLSLSAGNPEQAIRHYTKALSIYKSLFANKPELFSEKRDGILNICNMAGLNGNIFLN
jgi:tetratricopeptide (TPR) repeat protein